MWPGNHLLWLLRPLLAFMLKLLSDLAIIEDLASDFSLTANHMLNLVGTNEPVRSQRLAVNDSP